MATSRTLRKPRDAVLVLGSDQLATDVARTLMTHQSFERVYTAGAVTPARHDRHRKLDLLERGAVRRLATILAHVNPRMIVQLAGSRSPVTPLRRGRYDLPIAETVGAAVDLWRTRGGRPRALVVLSATAVYGLARFGPLLFDESHQNAGGDDPEPASAYTRWVRELRASEDAYRALARRARLDLTVLRAAAVVGGPVTSQLADYLSARLPVRVAGYDPPVQVVHYSDLLQAAVRALEERVTGTINVVGRGVTPLSRLAALRGRFMLPLPPSAARLLAPDALGVGPLCWRCVADGSRALQTLGVTPQFSTEEAVAC